MIGHRRVRIILIAYRKILCEAKKGGEVLDSLVGEWLAAVGLAALFGLIAAAIVVLGLGCEIAYWAFDVGPPGIITVHIRKRRISQHLRR